MPRSSGRSSGRSGGGGFRSGGGGFSRGPSRSYSTGRSSSSGSNYRQAGTTRNMYGSGTTSSSNPNVTNLSSQRPGMGGMGLGSAVATGMALGGGSAIGHALVGSMFGRGYNGAYEGARPMEAMGQPGDLTQSGQGQSQAMTQEEFNQQQMKANPCFEFNTKFIECLKNNQQDISKCQNIFDDLISCEKSLI